MQESIYLSRYIHIIDGYRDLSNCIYDLLKPISCSLSYWALKAPSSLLSISLLYIYACMYPSNQENTLLSIFSSLYFSCSSLTWYQSEVRKNLGFALRRCRPQTLPPCPAMPPPSAVVALLLPRPASPCPADALPGRRLTRRDREVVDFTRSRVKNNTELTNLGN